MADEELPITVANPGLDIAVATLEALVDRFGPDFATEVRGKVVARAERLAASHDAKTRAEAVDTHGTAGDEFWDRLQATGSHGG